MMIGRFLIDDPFNRMFSVQIRVTNEGIFNCTLPSDVTAIFTEHGMTLGVSRRGSNGYFSADTLDGLKDYVRASIKILCSEHEVSREKVIRYNIETACSYSIDRDGEYWPIRAENSEWSNGTTETNATNRRPFGFRVYAEPCEKTVYRYEATGKERIVYESLYEHHFEDLLADPVQWLCNMHSLESPHRTPLQEVPLNEETVMFFVNLFKSIFSLNERIKPFVSPEGIQALAKGNIKLLSMAESQPAPTKGSET